MQDEAAARRAATLRSPPTTPRPARRRFFGSAPRAGRPASATPAAVPVPGARESNGRNGIRTTCRSHGRRSRFAAGILRKIPKKAVSESCGRSCMDRSRREPFGDLHGSESERQNDRISRRPPDPKAEIPQRKTPPFALRSCPPTALISAVPCPFGRSAASVVPGSDGRTA